MNDFRIRPLSILSSFNTNLTLAVSAGFSAACYWYFSSLPAAITVLFISILIMLPVIPIFTGRKRRVAILRVEEILELSDGRTPPVDERLRAPSGWLTGYSFVEETNYLNWVSGEFAGLYFYLVDRGSKPLLLLRWNRLERVVVYGTTSHWSSSRKLAKVFLDSSTTKFQLMIPWADEFEQFLDDGVRVVQINQVLG